MIPLNGFPRLIKLKEKKIRSEIGKLDIYFFDFQRFRLSCSVEI